MKRIAGFAIVALALMTGCSSKSAYKPEKTVKSLSKESSPVALHNVSKMGALLEDKIALSSDDVLYENLKDPQTILFANQSLLIYTKTLNQVKIDRLDLRDTKTVSLPVEAVGANVKGNILAYIGNDNSIGVMNLENNDIIFKMGFEPTAAMTNKVANPVFLGDLVVFGTLDGKLAIVDTKAKSLTREIVVSSEKEFNNIQSLFLLNGRLIASTMNKVLSVNPNFAQPLDVECREVIPLGTNQLLLLTREGKAIVTDEDLKIQSEKKFPFAHFVGAIYHKGNIYIAERGGYIIKTDKLFKETEVYSTSDFDDKFFATNKKFYINKSYYDIPALFK